MILSLIVIKRSNKRQFQDFQGRLSVCTPLYLFLVARLTEVTRTRRFNMPFNELDVITVQAASGPDSGPGVIIIHNIIVLNK